MWSQGAARYPVLTPPVRSEEKAKEGEKEVRYAREMAGDNLPVARTEIGRIGGLICWESESGQNLAKGFRFKGEALDRRILEDRRQLIGRLYATCALCAL